MIRKYLEEERALNKASFHMPGHKGMGIYREFGFSKFLSNICDYDTTEIEGADNLHNPEGIIKDLMESYSNIYDVDHSFLLVNGSSCGIIASILATCSKEKKLLMARNCHRSVHSALALSEIDMVNLPIAEMEGSNIAGRVEPDTLRNMLKNRQDIGAVILASPNYYGVCSNIRELAKVCHEQEIPLIVDQAHGAHLKFFGELFPNFLPHSGEESAADLVINSSHKTLASFTQSAILNVQGNLVDIDTLKEKLQLVQSTSPSYILMASLDINYEIINAHGMFLLERWKKNLEFFYTKVEKIKGIEVLLPENIDRTKINIDTSTLGITAIELEAYLRNKGVECELATGNILMAMTGIGNVREDYERLLAGLVDASKALFGRRKPADVVYKAVTDHIPKKVDKGVYNGKGKIWIDLNSAKGRISGGVVIPYPPGIPLALEGEVISLETLAIIDSILKRGEYITGIKDRKILCYDI